MKPIWICPVCRRSSKRRFNLKVHIKNCHPKVDALPVAFDPLMKESAVPRPETTYYGESFPDTTFKAFRTRTEVDEVEQPSSLRVKTRMLNELSDYGDALKRLQKHAPISINTSMFAALMASGSYSGARTTTGINYFPTGVESQAESTNGDSALRFVGFSGNICRTCGEVTVIFVGEFLPKKTAREEHLVRLKKNVQEKPLPSVTPCLPSRKAELVNRLGYFVSTAFVGSKYLYCIMLDIKENFWKLTVNIEIRAAVEVKMGIPEKINCVRMGTLATDHWAVRAHKHGRTEISEGEVAQFLENVEATYGIFWAPLDGLPQYYFMWIDEDKPNLRVNCAEILRILGT